MLIADGKSLEMIHSCLIIGCGRIAGSMDNIDQLKPLYIKSHSMCFDSNESINIIGYVDIDIEAARDLSNKYNVSYFSDSLNDALVSLKPDFISVCTPDSSHFEVVHKILTSEYCPRLIFLEKPALTSKEDFLKISQLAKQSDVSIIVNHTRRFDDNYKLLKNIIDSKEFGECLRIDCWYYNGWVHNGVHLVDTLQYLFDDKLTLINFIDCNHNQNNSLDTNLQGRFLLENCAADVFINCMDEKNYQLFELDFKFTKGRIRVENFEERFIIENMFVNEINERVLDFKILDSIDSSKINKNAPIVNAANVIIDILENTEKHDDYSIDAAKNTMETIWNIQEKYNNEFK